MPSPVIGQVLYYVPGMNEPMMVQNGQPCPAMVCNVLPNGTVNLAVLDSYGRSYPKTSITVIADTVALPASGPYCYNGSIVRAVPVLTSLAPGTAVHGGANLSLQCNGQSFTTDSVIIFDGTKLATTFVDTATLTATVKPSQYSKPATVQVAVQAPFGMSGFMPFKFT